MLRISGGWFAVCLIRELDVFFPFLGVRLIHECILYVQIYGIVITDYSQVQCDDCDQWYHTVCAGCRYEDVKDSNSEFHCGCV